VALPMRLCQLAALRQMPSLRAAAPSTGRKEMTCTHCGAADVQHCQLNDCRWMDEQQPWGILEKQPGWLSLKIGETIVPYMMAFTGGIIFIGGMIVGAALFAIIGRTCT
jgi:hypothetical protein